MPCQKTWESDLAKLHQKETEARMGGGESRLKKHRADGKLTARERIDYFLDPGSFVELNMLAEHQCHDLGMEKKRFPGDGVVTGHGTVAGRKIFIYAEDASVLGGSTGKTHGAKIHYILRLARENRVPIVCLNDSAGARIQEGMDNVFGITGMFYQNCLNSGVVPQIVAVMGACTGGAAYSAALCDFIIQVENTAHLFVSGPAMIKASEGEDVTFETLGGAHVHSTQSGVVHLVAKDDRSCLDQIRCLLGFLPQNNREKPARKPCTDPIDREVPELIDMVPIEMSESYKIKPVIQRIVDDAYFFEIQPEFATSIVIGFARMAGRVVGITANNPSRLEGYLDIDAADKASRFIRTCDAFNIPLISLVDVPGFLPRVSQEHGGLIRHGAKMLYAWSEATVPKISIITRKMYGGGIPAMGVHQIGFDRVFAWPSAEMQIVSATTAVKILYRRELDAAKDPSGFFEKKVKEYREIYSTPYHAASRSVIDAVIHPRDTRKIIISELTILEDKEAPGRVFRKHGNMPL